MVLKAGPSSFGVTLETVHIHLSVSDIDQVSNFEKGQMKVAICDRVDETIGIPQLSECNIN
ncbi:MAG: hypothetical protein ACKO37_04565 [Vampirovibrionales bacterium]